KPVVEPRRKSERWADSHARAASVALDPWTVAPSAPPGRTSDDGVPKSFQATCASSALAAARWACVGASDPVRTSTSGNPLALPWMFVSAQAEAATAMETARTHPATKLRCARI